MRRVRELSAEGAPGFEGRKENTHACVPAPQAGTNGQTAVHCGEENRENAALEID